MVALLVFAATLLVAVFLSELARRSVLSTAVLFLFAGFIAGTGALEWIPLEASNPVVQQFSTLVSYVKFLRQKYFKIYFNYVKQL
jgi:NhaP-type Na+/H+ or K+/H+ antiporter